MTWKWWVVCFWYSYPTYVKDTIVVYTMTAKYKAHRKIMQWSSELSSAQSMLKAGQSCLKPCDMISWAVFNSNDEGMRFSDVPRKSQPYAFILTECMKRESRTLWPILLSAWKQNKITTVQRSCAIETKLKRKWCTLLFCFFLAGGRKNVHMSDKVLCKHIPSPILTPHRHWGIASRRIQHRQVTDAVSFKAKMTQIR